MRFYIKTSSGKIISVELSKSSLLNKNIIRVNSTVAPLSSKISKVAVCNEIYSNDNGITYDMWIAQKIIELGTISAVVAAAKLDSTLNEEFKNKIISELTFTPRVKSKTPKKSNNLLVNVLKNNAIAN